MMKLCCYVTQCSVNAHRLCLMLIHLQLTACYNLSAVMMGVIGQWNPQALQENVTEVVSVPTVIELCS